MEVRSISLTKKGTIFFIVIFSLSIISGSFAANSCDQSTININVKVNHEFSLKLASNPSTGYEWDIFYDIKYLSLIDQLFIPGSRGNIGEPGTQIFKFKAIKPGETSIVMNYQRPWENCLPAKVVIYHVTITE